MLCELCGYLKLIIPKDTPCYINVWTPQTAQAQTCVVDTAVAFLACQTCKGYLLCAFHAPAKMDTCLHSFAAAGG